MPIGSGKAPSNELTEHIAAGTEKFNSGIGIVRDLDNDGLGYLNPMTFPGVGAQTFEGRGEGEVQMANLEQASGLMSAGGLGEQFDIEVFVNNDDHGPNSGGHTGLGYGPMNTGR